MKLKGNYSADATYDVGDVVNFTDNVFYHLRKPCPSGVPPTNTLYWSRLSQNVADAARLILDGIDIANSDDPKNISDNAIVLKSSTEGSKKVFIVTVDDDGELAATELEEES